MKLQLALMLCLTAILGSCDKEFGTPCQGCTPVEDPRSEIVLQCHVLIPAGLYTAEESAKIVDQANLELLDPTTRKVIARKVVAIKGNGDIVDAQSTQNNSAFLYSSEVSFDASWGVYIMAFHVQNQLNTTQERLIDCGQGYTTVRFNY